MPLPEAFHINVPVPGGQTYAPAPSGAPSPSGAPASAATGGGYPTGSSAIPQASPITAAFDAALLVYAEPIFEALEATPEKKLPFYNLVEAVGSKVPVSDPLLFRNVLDRLQGIGTISFNPYNLSADNPIWFARRPQVVTVAGFPFG